MGKRGKGSTERRSNVVAGAVPNGKAIDAETFPPAKLAGGENTIEYRQEPLCVREPPDKGADNCRCELGCFRVKIDPTIPEIAPVPRQTELEVAD